jgi:phosphoadenosine phosphosulfate reductase
MQPTNEKVQIAIERLQFHRDRNRDKTYLAFSGGKDSIVIYDLAKKAGIPLEPHYHFTTVDPPELTQFIKINYPEIPWDRLERKMTHRGEEPVMVRSMFQLIEWMHFPPSRRFRYCCRYLKERGGEGRTIIDGVRWAESTRRSKRMMFERCSKNATTLYLHPIIDWTDEDVWIYIRQNNLKYCSLYDEGFKRLGCILCPLGGKKQMLIQAERWPKYYNAYMRTFERMLKSLPPAYKLQWKSAEEVMHWYITGDLLENSDNDCEVFG